MVRGIPDFPFRLKVLFFVGGKGKLFIKKQILACFQQRSSSQIQPHLRKCTVAGAGKGRVKNPPVRGLSRYSTEWYDLPFVILPSQT